MAALEEWSCTRLLPDNFFTLRKPRVVCLVTSRSGFAKRADGETAVYREWDCSCDHDGPIAGKPQRQDRVILVFAASCRGVIVAIESFKVHKTLLRSYRDYVVRSYHIEALTRGHEPSSLWTHSIAQLRAGDIAIAFPSVQFLIRFPLLPLLGPMPLHKCGK
jgi:hypothetical protein